MTVFAFIAFAASHAALIVLFDKQRRKIESLTERNANLAFLARKYRKQAQQLESEIRMLTEDFRK